MGGTCGGSPSTGTSQFTYTTNPVTANCTVTATFSPPPVNGLCGPDNGLTLQSAPTNLCAYTATTPVVTTTETGWQRTCKGSYGGTNDNCSANIQTWTVTPSAGPEGTIGPNAQQTVNHGSATAFTVTPIAGYTTTVGGTCGGSPATGSSQFSYTTNAITADCTVTVAFALKKLTVSSSAGPGRKHRPRHRTER